MQTVKEKTIERRAGAKSAGAEKLKLRRHMSICGLFDLSAPGYGSYSIVKR